LKYEKSNLIHIQTKYNLIILTYKIDTLIALTDFFKKCDKCKEYLHTGYWLNYVIDEVYGFDEDDDEKEVFLLGLFLFAVDDE